MIVMKFGGTSVGSTEKIRAVLEIVGREAQRSPVVVVSAHMGVTDALLELGVVAANSDACTDDIEHRHREILEIGKSNQRMRIHRHRGSIHRGGVSTVNPTRYRLRPSKAYPPSP